MNVQRSVEMREEFKSLLKRVLENFDQVCQDYDHELSSTKNANAVLSTRNMRLRKDNEALLKEVQRLKPNNRQRSQTSSKRPNTESKVHCEASTKRSFAKRPSTADGKSTQPSKKAATARQVSETSSDDEPTNTPKKLPIHHESSPEIAPVPLSILAKPSHRFRAVSESDVETSVPKRSSRPASVMPPRSLMEANGPERCFARRTATNAVRNDRNGRNFAIRTPANIVKTSLPYLSRTRSNAAQQGELWGNCPKCGDRVHRNWRTRHIEKCRKKMEQEEDAVHLLLADPERESTESGCQTPSETSTT